MRNSYSIFLQTGAALLGLLASTFAYGQWQQATGIGGSSVNTFAANGTTVFAGTDTGGVYKSADAGLTWTAANNGLTNKNVNALAFQNNVLVAGIGNGFGGAIFRSADNGGNWAPPANQYFGVMFCFALKGSDIYAGTWYGVSKSTNDGNSWSSPANTGLPSNASVNALAWSGSTLFASVSSSSTGPTGLYVSTNNGSSWSDKSNGLGGSVPTCLAATDALIFAGTPGGVYVSGNGGSSWAPANVGLTDTDVHALLVNGSRIYVSTDDGVYESDVSTLHWTSLTGDLPQGTMVISLAIKNSYLLAGSSDAVWRRQITQPTGISEQALAAGFESYPNPVSDELTISTQTPLSNAHLQVMDVSGRVVYASNWPDGGQLMHLQLGSVEKGIYFVQLRSGAALMQKKIIIE